MMEGNGKEIIWQIKKIPRKVTSARLRTRPKIIPVTYKQVETEGFFSLFELHFWLGRGWRGCSERQG